MLLSSHNQRHLRKFRNRILRMFYLCSCINAADKIAFVSIPSIRRDTKKKKKNQHRTPRPPVHVQASIEATRVTISVNSVPWNKSTQKISSSVYITAGGPRWWAAAGERRSDWPASCQSALFTSNVARWNFPGYSTFTGYCRRPADYFRNRQRGRDEKATASWEVFRQWATLLFAALSRNSALSTEAPRS